jgi:hypothetical protein
LRAVVDHTVSCAELVFRAADTFSVGGVGASSLFVVSVVAWRRAVGDVFFAQAEGVV